VRDLKLMDNIAPLIDHEFALKQFSGNSALLLKMFGKFLEQYKTVDTLLQDLFSKKDIKNLKLQVHTVKGVSGNLGMKALHVASREFETQLEENTVQHALHNYIDVIHQTLNQVEQVITDGVSPERPGNVLPPQLTDTKQRLLSALNRNEFITQSKLTEFLKELSLNEEQKSALKSSIGDFDYEKAKNILG
jgi:histidine phosphotransfer protein HptB